MGAAGNGGSFFIGTGTAGNGGSFFIGMLIRKDETMEATVKTEAAPETVTHENALPENVLKAVEAQNRAIDREVELRRQRESELAAAKKEIEVLKQNAASAAKAPVRGSTYEGSKAPVHAASDEFIRGFDSAEW